MKMQIFPTADSTRLRFFLPSDKINFTMSFSHPTCDLNYLLIFGPSYKTTFHSFTPLNIIQALLSLFRLCPPFLLICWRKTFWQPVNFKFYRWLLNLSSYSKSHLGQYLKRNSDGYQDFTIWSRPNWIAAETLCT